MPPAKSPGTTWPSAACPRRPFKLFRLGYAPAAWDDTVNWAKSKHYDLALVEKAGLIIRKEGEGETRFYDRFRGRLMFPICDEQGRVIAFSGRVLAGDEKTAKYVNSPETPIFTKSRVFYGLDKSKRATARRPLCHRVRRATGLDRLPHSGRSERRCPPGHGLHRGTRPDSQRYVDEVVLCFDSDDAGQTPRFGCWIICWLPVCRFGWPPCPRRTIRIASSKRMAPRLFSRSIQSAEGFFDFYLNRLCSSNDPRSDRGQSTITRSMAAALHKASNSVLMDKYAQKTALRLGVSVDAVRLEFRKSSGPAGRKEHREAEAAIEPAAPPSATELWLLKLILLHEDQAGWLAEHLDLAWIQHPGVRQVLTRRLDAHARAEWTGAAGLLSELNDAGLRSLVSQVLAEARPVPRPEEQLRDIGPAFPQPGVRT